MAVSAGIARAAAVPGARAIAKPVAPRAVSSRDEHGIDARELGRLAARARRERVERVHRPLDLDPHALPVVQHEAGEPVALREREHERPEADALHDARHVQ